MTRSPENKISAKNRKNSSDLPDESQDGDNLINPSAADWQRDIEKRDYYYDDSHGYEVYNPDEDEENDEN